MTSSTPAGRRAQALFFAPDAARDFSSVLAEVQAHISSSHAQLFSAGDEDMARGQLKRYIRSYLQDGRIAVDGMTTDALTDAIYAEMSEYSFLTKYLRDPDVEEINVNSWRSVEVIYTDGRSVLLDEHFQSPEHAVNVIRRMLHKSGMVIDDGDPAVLGSLAKNIRIAAFKSPLVDDDVGVACSIRIVNPRRMGREEFISHGTATAEMLDFLAACVRYGVSVCLAGGTGSGKTTVTGWLLSTLPDSMRVGTIESGSRELNLVRERDGRVVNSVLHALTRPSEIERQNITQDILLDYFLRFDFDLICVGEMRGPEAYAAQEAARTGHTVVSTVHSNSCDTTWRRIVTLCKRASDISDATLLELVTEAFPIVAYAKQLEDKSRRLMEIMECVIHPDGARKYRTLYRYHIDESRIEDGKHIIQGHHEQVSPVSEALRKRFLDNGMPTDQLSTLCGTEGKDHA